MFGIDGRYASALFSAGSKQNKLEAIEKDLNKFQVCSQFLVTRKLMFMLYLKTHYVFSQTALKSDEVLKEFIDNPINKREIKASTLQLASKKLALSPPASNFLGMIV